ncbi:uncharacterized protein LOC109097185 [Cyprinus carpio]|uniref:Uncharacterized protein LOC109097185 n=1 Tax=Cyprinus carpio TaxID=7962 RepID=A0A9Q9YMJ8_CYPCA|nr:uncharacterized protein LOC109097185 [Cyprinus carpio]
MALFIFIIFYLLLVVKLQGLATMSSLPPITEGSPTTVIPNGTLQVLGVTSTTESEITTDLITNMSSLSSQDNHSLKDPANASLESTTLTDNTERASVFPLMTKGPEIRKYSNTKMFFLIAVVASGGGIVLTGLVGTCLYRYTRKSKAERIWIESSSKKHKQGPVASSDSSGEEDTVLYSTINFIQPPSQPPGNNEESIQNEVRKSAGLTCTCSYLSSF